MLNFCTLFDINFATQGIAMYESLKKHCEKFHLYIFAFCDKSYELLTKLNLENVTVISLNEFEDEDLLRVKPTRTTAEYCWTCSSSTIRYCLDTFNLEDCTYIDADLYFYSNPKVLIDEMGDKSVLITEHRYTPEFDQTKTSGKYCVQFITFKNDEKGREVLNWWRNSCIDWCYSRFEDGKFGDQKYLDDWTTRFDCVHVLEHIGGGVAPWNIHQYRIIKSKNKLFVLENNTEKPAELVFYHFHAIKVQKNGKIDIERYKMYNVGALNQKLIYGPYLKKLFKLSKRLKKTSNSIIIVTGIPNSIKGQFKKFRKSIIEVRFSSKNPTLKLFGISIIKSK